MITQHLQPESVAVPSLPLSPAVTSGGFLFTSGQVAFGRDGRVVASEFDAQVRQVFANIEACLSAAGCAYKDVVKVTALITDFANFATFNAIYNEFFQSPYPARTTAQAGLAPGILVEVEVIARLPED